MKLSLNAGVVSQTMNIHVLDSSSTVGAGLTGIPATGVTAYYVRPRSAPVQIPLVPTGPTGPYVSGLWSEISSANMPGFYRVDLPDAVFATGPSVAIVFKGYTNMVPVMAEIQLDMPVGQVYGSVAGGVTGAVGSVAGSVVGNIQGNVWGGVTGPVGSVSGNIQGNIIGGVTGPVNVTSFSTSARSTISDACWDADRISHTSIGTFGQGIASVSGAVGSVTGSVGSVAGNVSGNILGGVTGPVRVAGGFVDSVQGNITGNLLGGVTGPVRAAGGFIDSVEGYVAGSIYGGITGPIRLIAANTITNSAIASGAIDENKITAGFLTSIRDIIWNALTVSYASAGTFGKKFADWVLGTDSKALISTDTQNLAGSLSVNVGAIAGDTTVPLKLGTGAGTMVISTAATGTLTTSIMTTNLSNSTDSIYINRYVYFTTGALTGSMSKISAYAGSTKQITFSTALSAAPSNGDTFIII